MWMKNTRSLRVLATVFHKHKYIYNSDVTPANRIIADAGALAKLLTVNLPQSLNDTAITHMERLGSILKPEVPVPKTQSPRIVATRLKLKAATSALGPPNIHIPPPRVSPPLPPQPRVVVPSPPRVDTLPQTPRLQHTMASPHAPHKDQPPTWRSPRVAALSPTPINRSSPAYNTRSRAKAAMFAAIAHRRCMSPQHLVSRRFPSDMLNAVLDDDTSELMEYLHLMKSRSIASYTGTLTPKRLDGSLRGCQGNSLAQTQFFHQQKGCARRPLA